MPPVLALEGVTTSFGAVSALRDVRLGLVAGEAHDPFTFNDGNIDQFTF